MARMLPVAHAARYACQAARNQARPRWGTINKFEVATSFRQVTTPLHYLRGRAAPNQSQPKMPGPGCDKCKDKCQDCKCGDNCSCCDSGCKDQCSCKSGGKCSCKPCTC